MCYKCVVVIVYGILFLKPFELVCLKDPQFICIQKGLDYAAMKSDHSLQFLTHYYLETHKGSWVNSEDPDQMPHDVASDLGLHCLLKGFSIKSRIKATK